MERLSIRLKKLRQLAKQIQQEVKDVCDSQVTIQILRTSRVGKEAVKTVKVMRNCRGTISATVDKWKECLSKGSEKKKVKLGLTAILGIRLQRRQEASFGGPLPGRNAGRVA